MTSRDLSHSTCRGDDSSLRSDATDMLKVKLATVIQERHAGRGDYDRLGEIISELRAALQNAAPPADAAKPSYPGGLREASSLILPGRKTK